MKFTIISVAILASSISYSATPIDGWYGAVFGGYSYVPNNINTNNNGWWRTNSSYQSGYDAGAAFGFKSTPMRYEGELSYLNANLRKFNINYVPQTGVSGYSEAILAMANVYYDFPNWLDSISPYIGVGIGYGWVNAQLNSTGPVLTTQFSGENSVFAYQASAGLSYNFSENYALSLGYRYVATERVANLGHNFQTQMANLGAVYRFDGKHYK